jgi:hypothetical protein
MPSFARAASQLVSEPLPPALLDHVRAMSEQGFTFPGRSGRPIEAELSLTFTAKGSPIVSVEVDRGA